MKTRKQFRPILNLIFCFFLLSLYIASADYTSSSDTFDTSPYHAKTSHSKLTGVIFDGEGDIFACQNAGTCQECSEADIEKGMPYCTPYPNKQAISCHYIASAEDREEPLPTWRSCRRVPGLERWRFFEFTILNAILAFSSCLAFLWRTRTLAAIQYRKLAARIGILNV